MVCVLLYSARLEPSFWSYALVHSVYIKNWLWHSALRRTLIETLTGAPPDLSHLRVFGSKVRACKPGQPRAKVKDHVYDGVFSVSVVRRLLLSTTTCGQVQSRHLLASSLMKPTTAPVVVHQGCLYSTNWAFRLPHLLPACPTLPLCLARLSCSQFLTHRCRQSYFLRHCPRMLPCFHCQSLRLLQLRRLLQLLQPVSSLTLSQCGM